MIEAMHFNVGRTQADDPRVIAPVGRQFSQSPPPGLFRQRGFALAHVARFPRQR